MYVYTNSRHLENKKKIVRLKLKLSIQAILITCQYAAYIVSEIRNNYRQNTHMCHVHTKINRKINKQIKLKDIY
jgi:hypothetical protein